MEVFRYGSRRLPILVAGVMGIALALCAMPASAASRGGGGSDYLLTSPTLDIDDVVLNEGNAGTTTFTFTISLSKPSPDPICVDVYTVDGTATVADSDYQPISTNICIPANTTSYTVDVLVNGDTTAEPPLEVFYVKIANPTGGGSIGNGTGQGIIVNDDGSTPTLLETFEAQSAEDGISLRWQFANAADIASSWLERARAQSDSWTRVDAELGNEGGMLVALDRSIESEQTYQYRLTAQMKNGQTVRFGPITVTSGVIVKEFSLASVSPNPTNGPALINFALPRQAHVKLSVLDVQGRQVEVLVDGVVGAGRHQATWTSRGASRSGVFFVRFETPGGKSYVKRVVVAQ